MFSTTNADSKLLALQLEELLAASTGQKIAVFVLSPADLRKAAASNPFDPEQLGEECQCHLMFLSTEPDKAHRKALIDLQGKGYDFHIQDRVLYYIYSRKQDGSRRNINFEKILGVTGTARSWKVINKLIELSG